MVHLKRYIRPYWGLIIFGMAIKLFGVVLELMIPYLMEIILDIKIPAGDVADIYVYGGLMILCAAVSLGFNIWSNYMSAISSGRITQALRHDLFEKLQHLSARQMEKLTIPSAESRLTSDTYNVNQFLTRIQRMGVRAPIMLVGGVGVMLSMDPVLALVLVSLLPLIALVSYYVTKTTIPLYTKEQHVLDRVVRTVQENITGIRVVRALNKTEYEKKRFDKVNDALTDLDKKAGYVTAISNPLPNLIMNMGLVIVILVGAYRVNSGDILSGVIVAFLQYFTMILNAMLGMTRIFVMWSKGEASAKRVADVLIMPKDLSTVPSTQQEKNGPHIEFREVKFSYTGVGKNIENLSFCLEHGQTLGILGATGSGKTTILSLLMNFYEPDSGTVLIDGQDIRTIPNAELRKKFGVAFQNDFLVEGTVADNIRFFRDLPDENIKRAAKDAQADFVYQNGQELDAPVSIRGNNLSGGQKQRVLIARALADNAEILVLDDSSSALDYQTDAKLRKALRKHYQNTTTILVAQRVSSLQYADLILMLFDGKVLGIGTHEQLMKICPEYRMIALAQMGDGKEEKA